MASEAKTTAGQIDLFKYDPIANGSDTFNIDKALNENWDKITGEFVRQAQEDAQLSEQMRTLEEQVEGLDVSWEGVGGKPDAFPPTQHGHTINEVNGLQEELNKKAPTHAHPYASTATATQSANGLQSAADKKKLDGIATGANNYVHPSGTNPHKTTKADVGLGNVPNYGASSSTTSTSATTLATSKAVKDCMDKANQAFQSADSGKTALATAITAKGVLASETDSFATLANKVGEIRIGITLTKVLYATDYMDDDGGQYFTLSGTTTTWNTGDLIAIKLKRVNSSPTTGGTPVANYAHFRGIGSYDGITEFLEGVKATIDHADYAEGIAISRYNAKDTSSVYHSFTISPGFKIYVYGRDGAKFTVEVFKGSYTPDSGQV